MLQAYWPDRLPQILKTWKFLPHFTRSLKPYDYIIMNYLCCCACCRVLVVNQESEDPESQSNAEKQLELARMPAPQTNIAYEIESF